MGGLRRGGVRGTVSGAVNGLAWLVMRGSSLRGLRLRCWRPLGWYFRKAGGNGLCFGAGVGSGVTGELKCHVVAVVPHLRSGLREPAVNGAVHQLIAEGEHGCNRN